MPNEIKGNSLASINEASLLGETQYAKLSKPALEILHYSSLKKKKNVISMTYESFTVLVAL